MSIRSRTYDRMRRHQRIRKKISGTAERPRMAIMRSGRNMYVQFIDDEQGVTLASASTLKNGSSNGIAAAQALGAEAGKAAVEKGLKKVVVDRGGFRFHGRLEAIVASAVEAGLDVGGIRKPAAASDDKENK